MSKKLSGGESGFCKSDNVLVVNGHQRGQAGTVSAVYGRPAVRPDVYLVEDGQGGQFVEIGANMAIQGRPVGASGQVWLNESK